MILDLKDTTTWDPVISKGLKSILGHSYPDTLNKNAETILYTDSDSEAYDLFSDYISKEDIRKIIKNKVCQNFTEVLVYHACRPTQTNDYYKKGIVPLSSLEAQQNFRNYFKSYVSHKDIDTAITEVSLKTIEGMTYALLDDRDFLEHCGHYLIYGSEYQNSLVINLPGATEQTRDILKGIGKATVFICRLPFSSVTDLDYLVPMMLADHFYRIAHKQKDVNIINYSIALNEKISPDAIVRHYHPIRIKDPFKNRAIWNDEKMGYEYDKPND